MGTSAFPVLPSLRVNRLHPHGLEKGSSRGGLEQGNHVLVWARLPASWHPCLPRQCWAVRCRCSHLTHEAQLFKPQRKPSLKNADTKSDTKSALMGRLFASLLAATTAAAVAATTTASLQRAEKLPGRFSSEKMPRKGNSPFCGPLCVSPSSCSES